MTGEEQQPLNNPSKTCRPGRGTRKGASHAQTFAGQRHSARQKKRSAIVLENDWLAAKEMLTAHSAAATKAVKDRRANFHNIIRNELPVRKLSLHIVLLKLTLYHCKAPILAIFFFDHSLITVCIAHSILYGSIPMYDFATTLTHSKQTKS